MSNTVSITCKSEDFGLESRPKTEAELYDIMRNAAHDLGIETKLGRDCFHALCEAAILLDRKNKDYGPGNISAFGEKGVIVRLNDKIERLKTLVWNDKSPEHEKVSDTWLDVTNYGIIGLMCHRGLCK